MRRGHTLASTTDAVEWTIFEADDFNVPRIDLVFDAAPTSAGLLTVTKDSVAGSAYDTIVFTINPIGLTTINIETLHGFVSGDKLIVEYANPDGVEITGTASAELPLLGDLSSSGITADNGTIRSLDSSYRRYYHVPITAVNPGASGATWVSASATVLSGWKLDAATEYASITTDIHGDWDTSTNPVFEFTYTVNTDNAGGTENDVVDYRVIAYYAQAGDTEPRTQTVDGEAVIGACDQYTVFKQEIELDRTETDNELLIGDVICCRLICLNTGDVTDITLNSASFYYNTTHLGIESGDA